MAAKGEKTRQKILDAAERLFADQGFDATSVESIAAAAGVNKALIYYYFKDKWRRHFSCSPEEFLEHFLSAFARTHLAAHGQDPAGAPAGRNG